MGFKSNWFEIQPGIGSKNNWFQVPLPHNGFEIRLIWDALVLKFNCYEFQLNWKWFEIEFVWWNSSASVFWCDIHETSFKNGTSKRARDFCTRLPSTRQVQNLKRSCSERFPLKMEFASSKTKLFCTTSFKNDMSTTQLTSAFEYIVAILMWMLQKYCAGYNKLQLRRIWKLVTATRNDSCKATPRWRKIWDIQRPRPETSTSQKTKSRSLPREKHRCGPSNPPPVPMISQPSRNPELAAHFAKCRNPCACRAERSLNS